MEARVRVQNGIRHIKKRVGPVWKDSVAIGAVLESELPEVELLKQLFGSFETGLHVLGYDDVESRNSPASAESHGLLPRARSMNQKRCERRLLTAEWRLQLSEEFSFVARAS